MRKVFAIFLVLFIVLNCSFKAYSQGRQTSSRNTAGARNSTPSNRAIPNNDREDEEEKKKKQSTARSARGAGNSAARATSSQARSASGGRTTRSAAPARSARSGASAGTARTGRSATRGAAPTAAARSARSATGGRTARSSTRTSSSRAGGTSARSARSTAGVRTGRSASSGVTRPQRTARTASSGTAPMPTASSARPAASAQPTQRTARSARASSAPRATTARSANGSGTVTATQAGTSYYQRSATADVSYDSNYVDDSLIAAPTVGKTYGTNPKECQKQYFACMDKLCDDTNLNPESILKRCACASKYAQYESKDKELKNLITQINRLMNSSNELQGRVNSGILSSTNSSLNLEGQFENSADYSADNSDVNYGDTNSNLAKNGLELYSDAHENCKRYLDLCPQFGSNAETITQQYSVKIDKDCRVFEQDYAEKKTYYLEKLKGLDVANEKKETELLNDKYASYDKATCFDELEKCMGSDAICGSNFQYCDTENKLNNNKLLCISVLDKCRTSSDEVWNAFRERILNLKK